MSLSQWLDEITGKEYKFTVFQRQMSLGPTGIYNSNLNIRYTCTYIRYQWPGRASLYQSYSFFDKNKFRTDNRTDTSKVTYDRLHAIRGDKFAFELSFGLDFYGATTIFSLGSFESPLFRSLLTMLPVCFPSRLIIPIEDCIRTWIIFYGFANLYYLRNSIPSFYCRHSNLGIAHWRAVSFYSINLVETNISPSYTISRVILGFCRFRINASHDCSILNWVILILPIIW